MPLARTSSSIPASSSSEAAPGAAAEHVVFFVMKEGTPEETRDKFVEQLREMGKLEGVIQSISATSLQPSDEFSVGVYTRFSDKSFIDPYLQSSLHQSIIKDYVKPHTSNVVLLDYETRLSPPLNSDFGAVRTFGLKFKPEASAEDKTSAVTGLKSLADDFSGRVLQVTGGTNFGSPALAKGFDSAAVIRFKDAHELRSVTSDAKFQELLDAKVKPLLSSFICLDLVK